MRSWSSVAFIEALVLLLAVAAPARSGTNRWSPIGPEGARTIALESHPTVSGRILMSTFAGIWLSTDGGEHWLPVLGSDASLPFFGPLGFSPHHPDVLLVVDRTLGVWKSTDGGLGWSPSGTGVTPVAPLGDVGGWMLFDPADPGAVLFAWRRTDLPLYRSTDLGASWSPVVEGLGTELRVVAASVGTGSPARYYVATTSPQGGLFTSVDGGATWAAGDAGLPRPTFGHQSIVESVVADPVVPGRAFAASGVDGHVYRTENGGASWAEVSSTVPGTIWNLWIPPSDGRLHGSWFATDGRLVLGRSDDGGASWIELSSGFRYLEAEPAFDASDGDRFVVAFDRGLFRTDDGGGTWLPVGAGLRGRGARAAAVAPSDPDRLYLSDGGHVLRSDDGGVSTVSVRPPWDPPMGESLAIHPADPDSVLTGAFPFFDEEPPVCAVVRSTDGGETWTQSPAPAPQNPGPWWYGPIQIWALLHDPVDPTVVYAAAPGWNPAPGNAGEVVGVFRSTDGGQTWVQSSAGLPTGSTHFPSSLAALPSVPTTLFLALNATGGPHAPVFRSTDGGATWSPSATGLDGCYARALLVHPDDPTTLFAGCSRADGGAVLFRSLDSGASWSPWGAGLDSVPAITALVADPGPAGTFWAATLTSGVLRSIDFGATWEPFAQGLSSVAIWDLAASTSAPTRLVAAGNGGWWELTVDSADGDLDGIGSEIEDAGPNGGDGNGDGIPDSQQIHVATLPTSQGTWATVAVPDGVPVQAVEAPSTDGIGAGPAPGALTPHGLLGFSLEPPPGRGCVEVELHVGRAPVVDTYLGYGPRSTPLSTTPAWYDFPRLDGVGAEIVRGADRTRIDLRLCDGALGDHDLAANGQIVHRGAPAAGGLVFADGFESGTAAAWGP